MVSSTKWHDMDGSPIIVTENVVEYRKAIAEFVTADDVVLEVRRQDPTERSLAVLQHWSAAISCTPLVQVGCAEGVTTALIAEAAKQVVGIDKSPSQADKAAARHLGVPNLSFAQVDGYDLAAVRRLADAAGVSNFSVIFIDVSGSRKVGDVETLLVKYEQVFNPRLFIVKAYQLKRLITRCQLCTTARHAAGTVQAATADGELLEEEEHAGSADAAADEKVSMKGKGRAEQSDPEHPGLEDGARAAAATAGLKGVQLL